MSRAKQRRNRPRRSSRTWIIVIGVLVLGVAALIFWPRGPAYAKYVDGVRPAVVFVWSDPTPHHPHG